MLEVLKLVANWGFPAFFCVLFYWDFRKKIMSLDKAISNDLTHALEKNTEATKKNSESDIKVERVLEKLDDSINRLTDKIVGGKL